MDESAFDSFLRLGDRVDAVRRRSSGQPVKSHSAIIRENPAAVEREETGTVDQGGRVRPGGNPGLGVSSKKNRILHFNIIIFFISTNVREPSPGRASSR